MSKKIEISEPYEELVDFRKKLIFLNSAKIALNEKVQTGDTDFSDAEIGGAMLIDWDLETELKSILTKIETLL